MASSVGERNLVITVISERDINTITATSRALTLHRRNKVFSLKIDKIRSKERWVVGHDMGAEFVILWHPTVHLCPLPL